VLALPGVETSLWNKNFKGVMLQGMLTYSFT
jgi:hypothetical protein